ncbi:zonular occludens toxin domain-containing protein [Cerasicoccus fimbriatus]|uniref:zonular occludens toxin domain-containing protein n=1 Tax=Cerasicoccus fimbriatus TaxID=3014554 RepID=UPI0022B53859|nr:zonular occludens toxin domain-containing protein [Cerasicoccus sp. TK19100]
MKDCIFRVYSGTLGSYKSYHAVREALNVFRAGGIVFTNIPLKWDRITMYFEDEEGLKLDDRQYVHIPHGEAGKFTKHLSKGTRQRPNRLIIDEAGIHHNSKDLKQSDRAVFEMIVHARKMHIDTTFIAHDFQHINKQVRDCAQSVFTFRDLQKLKWWGIELPFPYYCYGEFDARNAKLQYDKQFLRKDKRIYTFYQSHDIQAEIAEAIADSPDDIEVVRRELPPKKPNPLIVWGKRAAFTVAVSYATIAFAGGHEQPAEQPKEAPAVKPPQTSQIALDSVVGSDPEQEKETIPTFQTMGVMGMVTGRTAHQIPARHDFCRYSSMRVVLDDGRIITELDPRLTIRMHDRKVMFDGVVYQQSSGLELAPKNDISPPPVAKSILF